MRMIAGPTVISIIVTTGFFITLFLFLARPIALGPAAETAVNILIGVLGAQFANVVQFQIGSTSSSKAKDDTIKAMAEQQKP